MAAHSLTYPAFGGQSIPKATLLEGILTLLPDFIFWKDTHGHYLGCNVNFAELVRIPESDQILGKTDEELPWRDGDGNPIDVFKRWDGDVVNDELVINRHLTVPLATGARDISLTQLPLLDEEGHLIGLVGFFRGSSSHRL